MNTDFIDNSAGVDTSDHEVNIKILLADAITAGTIGAADRVGLLHDMTDEVAAHVLAHNDAQNMALAVARYQASRLLHVHFRYIRKLVLDGRVSLAQDGLPGDKEIAERRSSGRSLTSPELSVLLAHTKIAATQDVLASDLPDDPYLRGELARYFRPRCVIGSPRAWPATGCTGRSSLPPSSTRWWTRRVPRSCSGWRRRPVPPCPS